jgi:hypothetical protein
MHPRPDDRMLIDLEVMTHSTGRQVFIKKPGNLLPGISDLFEYLKQLVTSSPPRLRQRLCSIAGETAALAGQLSWRLGDPADAVEYYVAAEDMAIRAGDSGLHAFVLGLRSVLYSGVWRTDGEADPRMALALLNKAVQVVGKTSRPHLKTFLFSVRGEENAVAGREVAAGHDLDRAHRATTEPRGFDEGFLSHWDAGRWAGYQAHCALVLRGKHVVRAIEEALAMTDPSLTGASSATLADLAAAYALEDEVECSCALLIRSVVVAAQGGSQPHLRRALRVRGQHLAHRADAPAVRELDQRLRALMAVPDRH